MCVWGEEEEDATRTCKKRAKPSQAKPERDGYVTDIFSSQATEPHSVTHGQGLQLPIYTEPGYPQTHKHTHTKTSDFRFGLRLNRSPPNLIYAAHRLLSHLHLYTDIYVRCEICILVNEPTEYNNSNIHTK